MSCLQIYPVATRSDPAIGRCEWCGVVDHQLVAGECPRCRQASALLVRELAGGAAKPAPRIVVPPEPPSFEL